MMFRRIHFRWHVLGAEGWDPLPPGVRPSDFVQGDLLAFSRTPPPMPLGRATCDTVQDCEEALTQRVAVRVALRFGRSVPVALRQMRRAGRRRSTSMLRRAVCLAARTCGVSREVLATFLARSTNAISSYTVEARAFAVEDDGFRRACEDIVDAEHDAGACASSSAEGYWVGGAAHRDAEAS